MHKLRIGFAQAMIRRLAPFALSPGIPLETLRKRLDAAGHIPPPKGVSIRSFFLEGIHAEWIIPQGAPTDKVFLYFHGGIYVMGSCASHRNLVAMIALASGIRVLLIDYRLAPEHPYPAALEDAIKAYQWLRNTGFIASNIAFAGDSAGGNLTLTTLFSLRDHNEALPKAAACLCPWTDLTAECLSPTQTAEIDPLMGIKIINSWAPQYYMENDPKSPLISPVYGDFTGLPPLLIQVGAKELILSDSQRAAKAARASGVDVRLSVYDEMFHVWHFLYQWLPAARSAIDEIAGFLKRHLLGE